MREAQPVPGEELPFLYIRTAASTAPDDALEPYPAARVVSEETGVQVTAILTSLSPSMDSFR